MKQSRDQISGGLAWTVEHPDNESADAERTLQMKCQRQFSLLRPTLFILPHRVTGALFPPWLKWFHAKN